MILPHVLTGDKGKISQEEYDNCVFPNYYRTKEETLAPFQDPNSAVSKAGLKVKRARGGGCS